MHRLSKFLFVGAAAAAAAAVLWFGPLTSAESRALGAAVLEAEARLRPAAAGGKGEAIRLALTIRSAEGLPKEAVGRRLDLAARLPGQARLETEIDGHAYRLGRDGDRLWIHVPHRSLAIEGSSEIPRFASHPDSAMPVELPALRLPLPRWQLRLLPAAVRVEPGEAKGEFRCRPRSLVARMAGLPEDAELRLRTRGEGRLAGVDFKAGKTRLGLEVEALDWLDPEAAAAEEWGLALAEGEEAERVALSHLERFARVSLAHFNARIPALPPADGSREVLARHGQGRLEMRDGTRVLFLKGTPEEMGQQQGALLRGEIRNLVDRIVYGVGVGSSFSKGRWFFGEIEEAQARLEPYIDPRYLREMDAMAAAAGIHPQEARLANFFPELFHCSGFALHGSATAGGRIYHGRVLDYLRGLGLEQNAVVIVTQPDEGHAWVNVGYAGFTGTVTAMNEKQVAIGEMGGRGEGDWDGKPMAQLMREVMERASTIDEAVEIMREGPRTCEYYYVISDAKSSRACGIKATPDLFEVVWSGESHPELPRAFPGAVLMSSGSRYQALADRVEAGLGSFDADTARALMDPPVCMNSNIQSVLFAPDTLEFWVANADSASVASLTRYTRYDLRELLGQAAAACCGMSAGTPPARGDKPPLP